MGRRAEEARFRPYFPGSMRLGRSFRSSSCSSPPAPASAAGPTFNVTLKGSFKGAPVSGDVQFGNLISRR